MKKLIPYTGGNAIDHKKVGDFLRSIAAGEQWILEIKKNRPIRSIPQNKFYHAVLQLYAIGTGYDKDDIEYWFKMAKHYKITITDQGEEKKSPAKTSNLDTKEFTNMVNALLQWGRDEYPAVIVPRREDLNYIQMIEIENQYEKDREYY